MSGKTTFRGQDRRHIEAAWDAPLPRAVDWPTLEAALERPLAAAERERVTDILELHATWIAQADAAKVTTQDIKRTLAALAAMQPDDARKAYARADGWTQAQIASAMLSSGSADAITHALPTGEQIIAAAQIAAGRIVGRGGRPMGAPRPICQGRV